MSDGVRQRTWRLLVPGEAFVMQEPSEPSGTAELYNSGCESHLSPYRHLPNFEDI